MWEKKVIEGLYKNYLASYYLQHLRQWAGFKLTTFECPSKAVTTRHTLPSALNIFNLGSHQSINPSFFIGSATFLFPSFLKIDTQEILCEVVGLGFQGSAFKVFVSDQVEAKNKKSFLALIIFPDKTGKPRKQKTTIN